VIDSANLFAGSKVLITGGMGFIGSNLARRLIEQGAEVVLVDNLIPEYGGNLFNAELSPVQIHSVTEAILTWDRSKAIPLNPQRS